MADHGGNDAVQRAIGAVFAGSGNAQIIGSRARRSVPDAAAVNAALMTARCQTDTTMDCMAHLGCVAIPAVLALAQERDLATPDIVAAIFAGYDVPPRLARGSAAASNARGFRGSSIYGVLAATAASARVMRLDDAKAAHALSIAANLASGLLRCYVEGTAEDTIQVAQACRSGVVAAMLAEEGAVAADFTFEGDGGFLKAFAGPFEPPSFGGDMLGPVVFKVVPGCIINQLPFLALTGLMRDHAIASEDVASVQVYFSSTGARYPGIDAFGPFSSRQGAIMSTAFMLEIVLQNGAITIGDYSARHGPDPVHEQSRRIRVVEREMPSRLACEVEIVLRGGSVRRCAMPSVDRLRLTRTQAVEVCRSMSNEWKGAGAGDFDRLGNAVTALVRRTAGMDAGRLVDATVLRAA